MTFFYYLCISLFMLISLLLCGVILLQESKSMGLGASFGGEAQDIFGTSTAQVLKKITAVLATLFLTSCVFISVWTSSVARKSYPTPNATLEEVQDA